MMMNAAIPDAIVACGDRVRPLADHHPLDMQAAAGSWSRASRAASPVIVSRHDRRGDAGAMARGISIQARAVTMVRTDRTTILDDTLWAGFSGLAGIVVSHYTSAGNSLAAIGVELDTIAAVVIGGTRFSGSQSSVLGLLQSHITFDGMLSSWRTEIVVGLLLFALILLPRIPGNLPARRAAGARGSM